MVLLAYKAACSHRTLSALVSVVPGLARRGVEITDCVEDVLLGSSIDEIQLGSLWVGVSAAGSGSNEDRGAEVVSQECHPALLLEGLTV